MVKKPNEGPAPVGVWAGSSPSKPEEIEAGLRRLKELGLRVRFPKLSRRYAVRAESQSRRFLAGPDEAKIHAFTELWRDPRIKDIFCTRGGYGTIRLLEGLDRISLSARQAKRVWGFSDLTVLQNYLYLRLGAEWVHSPMLTSRSFQRPSARERKCWEGQPAQEREHLLRVEHDPHKGRARQLKAPLIGGNLACFASLVGTQWARPHKKDFLLFLEDVSERGYRVDRLLQQLDGSTIMKKCQAVLLGHFTRCPGSRAILSAWAKERGYLLLSGLRAGHQRPNFPLVMGRPVTLQIKKSIALLKSPELRLGY